MSVCHVPRKFQKSDGHCIATKVTVWFCFKILFRLGTGNRLNSLRPSDDWETVNNPTVCPNHTNAIPSSTVHVEIHGREVTEG